MKGTPRPTVGMEAVQHHLADIVHQPQVHRCTFVGAQVAAGWWLQRYPELHRYPEGTVRACPECGATWVAGSVAGLVPSLWRREGRLEGWWRERQARRTGGGPRLLPVRVRAGQGGRKETPGGNGAPVA